MAHDMALDQNQVIGGVTGTELQASSWVVRHRAQFHRAIVLGLVGVAVGLWAYTLWGLVDYFLLSWNTAEAQRAAIMNDLVDYRAFRQRNAPRPLSFGAIQVFDLGGGRYDLAVEVVNPNERFQVRELRYAFRFAGDQQPTDTTDAVDTVDWQTTFLLPGQRKYLAALGVERPGGVAGAQLEIDAVNWLRVDNYPALALDRLALTIGKPAFAVPLTASGSAPALAETSFTVTNASAYSFWQNRFIILLYRGNQLAALTTLTENGLESGETRTVTVRWYQKVGTPTKIEVLPDVNILDPATFRPPRSEGSGGGEPRPTVSE